MKNIDSDLKINMLGLHLENKTTEKDFKWAEVHAEAAPGPGWRIPTLQSMIPGLLRNRMEEEFEMKTNMLMFI